LQSAASLLAIDYGTYTFIEADPLQTRTGRDRVCRPAASWPKS